MQVVSSETSVSYMWEMLLEKEAPPVRSLFSVEYRAVDAETRQRFKFEFTVSEYRVSRFAVPRIMLLQS